MRNWETWKPTNCLSSRWVFVAISWSAIQSAVRGETSMDVSFVGREEATFPGIEVGMLR